MIFLAILIVAVSGASAQFVKRDTCPCPTYKKSDRGHGIKPKKIYPANVQPGKIIESFNDSVVIEGVSPSELRSITMQEKFAPMVSNLKEIRGSFNTYVFIKQYPAKDYQYGQHWFYNLDWLWFLVLIGLLLLLLYLITRQQQAPAVTVNNNIPPAPPAPVSGTKTAVAPAVDINTFVQNGSTVIVYADGGVKVIPPSSKEQKKEDVADSPGEKKE